MGCFYPVTFNYYFNGIRNFIISCHINFVIFSIYLDDLLGQVYCLIILTIGASESAIGLAILIVYYRLRGAFLSI